MGLLEDGQTAVSEAAWLGVSVFGFVGIILLVVVGIHLYLWKRLVRECSIPKATRWCRL